MNENLIEDGSFINSIVGEGTAFRGELHLSGLLRIDGDFSGTIRTSGKVLIGKSGRAECTIRANTVVIGGVVRGNIYADEKVIVLSTGMMIGNIRSPRLIAEEGVILNGNCLIKQEDSESVLMEPVEPEQTFEALKFMRSEPKEDDKQVVGEIKRELSSWNG
ncbi:MAG: polymer-forming cytoskeletal protein [Spirochaetales bacterium]|jgi:cytoskeletal protein CcmA (bactofilin family)|nr:polymer-forming cytoskeletal protein [Spirochaetales bacterium]